MSDTTARFTPGPWQAIRSDPAEGADVWWIVAGGGNQETELGSFQGGWPAERREANAHLVAAAPDLYDAAASLEAAEEAHANCPECEGEGVPELCPFCFPLFDDARLKRRAALAKARSEP